MDASKYHDGIIIGAGNILTGTLTIKANGMRYSYGGFIDANGNIKSQNHYENKGNEPESGEKPGGETPGSGEKPEGETPGSEEKPGSKLKR